MLLRCYTIFDTKALIYHPPFFASNDASALRTVSDLANDLNTSVGRHPADYIVFCVGTYDDNTGVLEAVRPLVHLVDVVSLVTEGVELPLHSQKPKK